MRAALLLLAALTPAGCKREIRELRPDPAVVAAMGQVAVMPGGIAGAPPRVLQVQGQPNETNAYQLSQGKRLYAWFNCAGCHAEGGGGSGPALLDGWWRYGPDQVSVFQSIHEGRPNGMPSYRDRLTTDQIWQLVGYVRTIGASSGKTAAPGRNDAMQSRPAESRGPAAADIGPPPSRPAGLPAAP